MTLSQNDYQANEFVPFFVVLAIEFVALAMNKISCWSKHEYKM